MIKRIFKYLPVLEIIVGITLLTRELYQLKRLPSIHDNLYGGLVDFFKYKEDAYGLIILWSTLIIAGLFGLKNEKLKWLSNWILIIVIIGLVLVPFILALKQKEVLAIILGALLMGLVYVLILITNSNLFNDLKISNTDKLISTIIGLIIVLSYWGFELLIF
ncbi:hypothetical protein [Marinifilum flexuosum]|uniref:hypothetical protein n=1 Tax=Marinifilum flexuosum TaxID=1117708 RepID=UPI00249503E9|nr:hypothetical protein [Marinifilum flexuosum]